MGRCYPHLSLEERRKLAKWREAKIQVPEIADRLGRAPSTIYRELKRNYYDDKELPDLWIGGVFFRRLNERFVTNVCKSASKPCWLHVAIVPLI